MPFFRGTRYPLLSQSLVVANSYNDKVSSYSPVAFWPLDDASGSTCRSLVGGVGTLGVTGATLAGDTFLNSQNAITFDGVNDELTLPTVSGFAPDEGTVVCWAKTTTWAGGTFRNVFEFDIGGGKKFAIFRTNIAGQIQGVRLSNIISASSVSTTDWMALVLKWSKTANQVEFLMKIVGGSLTSIGTDTCATTTGAINTSFSGIGSALGGAYWTGSLGPFALFNTALSGADLTDLTTV